MVCIYCGKDTSVINSRLQRRPNQIWRRRICVGCRSVITTLEKVDYAKALAVKSVAGLEPFSRDKLLISIFEACKHRSDALEAASALTDTALAKLLPYLKTAQLEREKIIETVSQILKRFDKAAAVHYQAYHGGDV